MKNNLIIKKPFICKIEVAVLSDGSVYCNGHDLGNVQKYIENLSGLNGEKIIRETVLYVVKK